MSAGWNTIESDAGVFTYLLENLGVKDVQFEELLTLEVDELRQLRQVTLLLTSYPTLNIKLCACVLCCRLADRSPQGSPVYGVIFLFKYPTGEKPSDVPKDGRFDHEAAENIFFAAQTIQNACGTQALLSVLLNKDGEVEIGDQLREFKEFTGAFPSELRGEALSNSELIRDVHNSFARSSPFIDETQRTATEDDDVYHFIAYTSVNDVLYEIDGLQVAPISHGECTPSDFPAKVIPVLQRRIERYPAHEIRFNLLAMVRDLRIRARDVGDREGEEREERKRTEWLWENALRRHNFVGFVGEALKGVVAGKVREGGGAYDKWIEEAKGKTRARIEERRKKGVGGEED
ncbi:hypothetical protein MMC25_002130 [Agyrium rufum]|nr:hypothetical protein [Agyrium rufum]